MSCLSSLVSLSLSSDLCLAFLTVSFFLLTATVTSSLFIQIYVLLLLHLVYPRSFDTCFHFVSLFSLRFLFLLFSVSLLLLHTIFDCFNLLFPPTFAFTLFLTVLMYFYLPHLPASVCHIYLCAKTLAVMVNNTSLIVKKEQELHQETHRNVSMTHSRWC